MKRCLIIAVFSITLLSCDKECKEERDRIQQQYVEALRYAQTPEAVEQITRQRDAKLAELDC
jgi:hypothetical protein